MLGACLAEAFGTFVIVFFGTGAVHAAVVTGAQVGLWQVAIVWGLAVTLAIYATAACSGAHLNPAVTIALASWRGFPWKRVPRYLAAQLSGAFVASCVLYLCCSGILPDHETSLGISRGAPGSERSAMVYCEYFPNPSLRSAGGLALDVSEAQAMLAEGLGTFFFVFMVFALTDARNREQPPERLAAPLVGLTVSMVISVVAPLTQAGLNPARDFGPRVFAWLAGWGSVAIPGPRGGFFSVYILAPILGGLAGATTHEAMARLRAFSAAASASSNQAEVMQ